MTDNARAVRVFALVASLAAVAVLAARGDLLGSLAVVTVIGVWVLAVWSVRRRGALESAPEASYAALLAELTRSRREIVNAFEVERRRIERDLHDGAQQYLVAAAMKVGEARLEIEDDSPAGRLLIDAQQDTDRALQALRQTVHAIAPHELTDLGLEPAVRSLADRFPTVRVHCPHPLPPLPQGVLVSGYFVVSEALANAAKHAPGAQVTVLLSADQHLSISVTDTGPGGVTVRSGHGLSGLRERLASFGGHLSVTSPSGGPTHVSASLPLLLTTGQSAYRDPVEEER